MSMTPIKVELQLDSGRFQTDLKNAIAVLQGIQGGANKAGSSLSKVKDASDRAATSLQRTTRASQSLLGVWRDIAIVGNVFARAVAQITNASHGWLGEIVRVNAEMERLNFQMRAMSTADDPIKDAAQSVAWLRKEATQAPFSLKAITNSFVKLKAARLDPQGGTLRSFLDGLAAFGAGDEQLHRVSIAITQMAGKSVIQMEELRQQLGEHMPTAMRLMARSMGMTVAELTKVVSTGTLDARDSLEKLSKEMNRTYGGAAIRMMQTFSGQMTQMKANLQLLMTDSGGQAFFNVIKEQLLDINDFLSSNKAKVYAKQFGEGLAAITLTIKDVVSWFWKWRDVIVTVGTTLAGMYAIKKFADMARGLSMALAGGIGNLRSSLAGAASGIASLGTGLNGLRTGQHVMTSLGIAAMGLRGAFTALTASIPLLGIGLLGLQAVVTLFGNWESAADKAAKKTRELYEAAKEGASASYEEAKKANDEMKKLLEGELATLTEKLQTSAAQMMAAGGLTGEAAVEATRPFFGPALKDLDAARERKREELNKANEDEEDVLLKQQEADIASGQRKIERKLALLPEMAEANKIYNDRQNQLDTLREKEVQNAIDTGGSIQKVTNKFNRASIEEQKKLYDTRIRIADDERKAIEKAYKEGKIGAFEYAGQMKAVEEFAKEAKEARDALDVSKLIANTLVAGKDSNNTKIERAVKTVNKMEQALSDTKAEAIGMGDAYATMVAKIQNGSFGNYEGLFGQDLKNLQVIHQTLLDMAAQQALTNAQRDGFLNYSNDLRQMQRQNQNDKIQNEIEARQLAEGRKLTRSEIIDIKVEHGDYFGIGDEETIRKQFQEFAESLNKNATLATQLGDVLRTNAFGMETNQTIQTTANELETVNDELKETVSILGGFTFDNLSNIAKSISAGLTGLAAGFGNLGADIGAEITDDVIPALTNLPKDVETRMTQAMQHLTTKGGLSQVAAAGIVGNLVAESNLDPTRSGDDGTSIGIAQWHKERKTAMQQWITMQGRDWRDMNAQLDFLVYELRTSEKIAGEQLKLAGNPVQAAKTFMNKYERPAEWAKKKSWWRRAGAAQRAYQMRGKNGEAAIPDRVEMQAQVSLDEKSAREAAQASKIILESTADEKVTGHAQELAARLTKARNLTAAEEKKQQEEILAIYNSKLAISEKEKQLRQMFRDAGMTDETKLDKELEKFRFIEKQRGLAKEVGAAIGDRDKNQLETARRIAELNKQAANPNYRAMSAEMQQINYQIDTLLPKVRELHAGGENSPEYQAAYDGLMAKRDQQLALELAQVRAKNAQETQSLQDSLMTQSRLRRAQMQRDLARVDEWLAGYIQAYGKDVAAVEEAERQKDLIRKRAQQEATPVLKQMHEWQDIQGNLEKAATGWMESLTDGIAGLITGTGDLRGAIQGIINDIAKMATKWLLSGLFGGTGEGGQSALKQLFKKTATAGSMHTGGIAGDGSMLRSMSAITWAGAPKFHSGGFVGGLLPSEVPIIAKKGEGVFTPEQMKAMGGFQQNQMVQINSPITVNGSSGTPEQNNDLAKQMAREMDNTMRAIVADEMRKQTRPGSMMNTRAR